MSRKDFILIAETIRTSPNLTDSARRLFAEDMADALATTNARFDRGRFVAAATGE